MSEITDAPNELKPEGRTIRFNSEKRKSGRTSQSFRRIRDYARQRVALIHRARPTKGRKIWLRGLTILASEIGLSSNTKKYERKARPDYSLKTTERTGFSQRTQCRLEIRIPKKKN